MEKIIIRGAKTHNLKNVNAELPRNQLVVITGPSGSGKSSLAFDTLYAEGQRRYLEGLSPYARQFLNIRNKPDVDSIEGLSPAIAIDQKNRSDNPRSTVGSSTEILDYLRLLYSRVGTPYCPDHHLPLEATLRNGFLPGLRKHRLFFCPPFRQTSARILSSSSRISRVRGSFGSESGVTLLKPKRRRLMRSRISVSELILWLTG